MIRFRNSSLGEAILRKKAEIQDIDNTLGASVSGSALVKGRWVRINPGSRHRLIAKKSRLQLEVRELEGEELLQARHGSSGDPGARTSVEKQLADRGVTLRSTIVEDVEDGPRLPEPQGGREHISHMDAVSANLGASTCRRVVEEAKAEIAAQTQALALMTARGDRHAGKLSDIHQRIHKESDRKANAEELLNAYERRLQTLSDRKPEPNTQSQRRIDPSRGSLNYSSELKRAISVELTRKPDAKDLEICRALDTTGAVELPDRLKSDRHQRLFETAYKDKRQRHRLEIIISKVRTDMRKKGLL